MPHDLLGGGDQQVDELAVLRALADAPGAPAAELARRTFVTRQSLRDVLAGLTRAGLVSVATQPTSGRALPVTITDAGQSLLEEAHGVVLDVEEHMINDLPPNEVQRLASLLTACARNLT